MKRSLAAVKSSSSSYCSSGSTMCRNSTPALAWKRRSSRSSSPPLGDHDARERVGDLGLRVPVRRQRAADGEDLHSLRSPRASTRACLGTVVRDRSDGFWFCASGPAIQRWPMSRPPRRSAARDAGRRRGRARPARRRPSRSRPAPRRMPAARDDAPGDPASREAAQVCLRCRPSSAADRLPVRAPGGGRPRAGR